MDLTRKDIYEVMDMYSDEFKFKFDKELIIHHIVQLNKLLSTLENVEDVALEGYQIILLYTKDMMNSSGYIKEYDAKNHDILNAIFKERVMVIKYNSKSTCDNSDLHIWYLPSNKNFTTCEIMRNPSFANKYKLFQSLKSIDEMF